MSALRERQLKTLEALINKALHLDKFALERLLKLEGKAFRVECNEPTIALTIRIHEEGINLSESDSENITSHLSGDLKDYLKLLNSEDKAAAIINSDLQLIGDSQLLIELYTILNNIDVDWEYHLAKLIGDTPAHLAGKIGRESFQWLASARPVFFRHLQEFIHEEARLSPMQHEMDDFIENIQSLSMSTERLEAKIKRLKQSAQQEPS